MAVAEGVMLQSQGVLKDELLGLRRSVLRTLAPSMMALGLLWFSFIVVRGFDLGLNAAPAIVFTLSGYAVLRIEPRRYHVAGALLIAALMVGVGLIVLAHPRSLAASFGVLVVLVSNALHRARWAVLVALLTWLGVLAATIHGLGGVPVATWRAELLLLYLFACGVAWITARPLNTSVEWALAGWAEAHKALGETRERRGELFRVVRALEEATYRIERMNNELIVAQREAELAKAQKARLAATISHELRAPLNLILGFARLMALSPESYGEPLPRAYRADVHTVYRNSQHLVSLVDDILDLSQIEAERLPLVKDRVDVVEDVVNKAVDIMRSLAERKGLALRVEIADNLPWILADAVRLRQALLNLLSNAIRFTEKGEVVVCAALADERLTITVSDTGPGIAAEELPNLFQEFRQLHSTERREQGGSGLGLSISKHLVELHNGEIWAQSEPGSGTAFTIALPLPGSEPAPRARPAREERPQRSGQPICLVVHGDAGVVRLLGRYIEGYRIVGLPDETQVAELARDLHPRAVLAGTTMAGRVRRELARLPHDVPMIICRLPSASDANHLEGVFGYLVKPVTTEMVTAVMRRVERNGETSVLLVDDDPDAVRLMQRMLMALPHPYVIRKAYDGHEALEIMSRVTPDVVFMDLMMPGMDGEETIARMRADERLCTVPVVAVSARDWLEERAVIGTPISLLAREPVDIIHGARALQALLEAARPSYLERAPAAPRAAAPSDPPVSAGSDRRPEPGPNAHG